MLNLIFKIIIIILGYIFSHVILSANIVLLSLVLIFQQHVNISSITIFTFQVDQLYMQDAIHHSSGRAVPANTHSKPVFGPDVPDCPASTKMNIFHPLFPHLNGQWPPIDPNNVLRCMHCSGPLNQGCPVPIVVKHDFRKNHYFVTDLTCRPACAKARIIEIHSFLMSPATMLTAQMCRLVLGLPFDNIMTAPPRLMLRIHGGNVSLPQFLHDYNNVISCQRMAPALIEDNGEGQYDNYSSSLVMSTVANNYGSPLTFDDSDPNMQTPIVIDAATVSNKQLSRHITYVSHNIFNGIRGTWPPPGHDKLRCMHCGGPCDKGCPVPMVIRYDAEIGLFHVLDITCTISCVKGRIIELNSSLMNMILLLTGRFCQVMFGVNFFISPAKPRMSLVIHGGTDSIEDFRKDFFEATLVPSAEKMQLIVPELIKFELFDVVAQQRDMMSNRDCCMPFLQGGGEHGTEEQMPQTYVGGPASSRAKAPISATIQSHSTFHSVALDQPMFMAYQEERAAKVAGGEQMEDVIPQKKSKKKKEDMVKGVSMIDRK